ncbi:MAG: molecular chaperone DjiA [Cucumibacter sp.]
MSVWQAIGEIIGSYPARTGLAGSLASLLDPDNWLPGGRDAAFTLALVCLSAKMAVADGVVTASEVRAFGRTVEIPPGAEDQVRRVFQLAQEDVAGYDAYARRIARFFADSPATLELVLDGLFHIASADGMIHEAEFDYLKSVSGIFGFDDKRFEQIASQHVVRGGGGDPYIVLGLDPSAPDSEIKRVWRRLVAENHPDRLTAKGVPDELIVLMSQKLAAINHANDVIARARGMRGPGARETLAP